MEKNWKIKLIIIIRRKENGVKHIFNNINFRKLI